MPSSEQASRSPQSGACPTGAHGDGGSRSIEVVAGDVAPLDLVRSELSHRFRNIVTVTQSLVNQTLHDGASVEVARDTLNQRLLAMAAAVDLLLRSEWQPGSLRETVREAVALRDGYGHRIRCDGPDVMLGGKAVMALTLALHELGTNAVKHGALSAPAGSVDLFWKTIDGGAEPRLWIQWVERDGPPVAPPARRGFGSRLISRTTGQALGGEVELDFSPCGVTWLLVAPLGRLAG